jgi:hypothetical protein
MYSASSTGYAEGQSCSVLLSLSITRRLVNEIAVHAAARYGPVSTCSTATALGCMHI